MYVERERESCFQNFAFWCSFFGDRWKDLNIIWRSSCKSERGSMNVFSVVFGHIQANWCVYCIYIYILYTPLLDAHISFLNVPKNRILVGSLLPPWGFTGSSAWPGKATSWVWSRRACHVTGWRKTSRLATNVSTSQGGYPRLKGQD